ncbi:MAG TPA: DUF3078 domain-containing protein [Bacteroidaceae bacterium]|nr:DUF3078 domain-containing protein [Bacteroidaceae bacterium]
MKRLILLTTALILTVWISAQDQASADTLWKLNGTFSLNFSQLALSNWAAGGENSIVGNGLAKFSANYDNKRKLNWDNSLKLGYGMIAQGDDPVRKSDDILDFSSKVGYKMSDKWLYSNMINFLTQFSAGYDRPGDADRKKISNLMSPGYLIISTGFDWKPRENFSLMLSPLTGKFTFVFDEDLNQFGAFGVEAGKSLRSEMGGLVKTTFEKELVKNVRMTTGLLLFSNYLKDPQNIDINWDLLMTFKVNEFISASLITNLIYDHDIKFEVEPGEFGPRTQFKELFGIGFTYSF